MTTSGINDVREPDGRNDEDPRALLLMLGLALSVSVSLLVLTPWPDRAWDIMQGTMVAWTGACVCWSALRARRTLPLAVLVAVLSLTYLATRPGGWYHLAAPVPVWSTVTCDGGCYWRSAIALEAGQEPFEENWYPPPFLQLYSLVGGLDEQRAFAVWWVIVYCSYMAAAILTYALLRKWRQPIWTAVLLTGVCWLGSWPAYKAAAELQINMIILCLLLYAWLSCESSSILSGASLAAAALLKISPLLPAGFVAIVHRRTWTLALVAALIVFVVLSMVVGPFTLWPQFVQELSSRHWASNSIDTAMAQLLGDQVGAAATLLLKLAILAYTVGHLWSARVLHRDSQLPQAISAADVSFALGLCCMVALSPVVWGHHRVWLVPAIAFAWTFCRAGSVGVLAIATALLLWLPMPPPIAGLLCVLPPVVGLLWCLRPGNLTGEAEHTALAAVLRAVRDSGSEPPDEPITGSGPMP